MTPLHLALYSGNDDVAKLLVEHVCRLGRVQPRWVRSSEHGRSCMCCADYFGFFTMKHHCRSCGIAVCSACSCGRLALRRWLAPQKPHAVEHLPCTEPLRVCDSCLVAVPAMQPTITITPDQLAWLSVDVPASAFPPASSRCKRCGFSTQTITLTNRKYKQSPSQPDLFMQSL